MAKLSVSETLRTALRIFGYTVAFGFIGFMIVPALMGASPALRIPLVGLYIAAAGMLFFMDGSYRGERDCTMSETLDKLGAKGTYTPNAAEEGKRFNRLKGVLSALIGALPLVIIAAIVAVLAKPFSYTLQDLPAWMGTYVQRPEIGDALVYLQGEMPSATIVDYLRIAVRFMLFPFVGLVGEMTDEMSLMFDRIAPLLALILPLCAAVGYQFGPRRRAKNVKAIEEAKRIPRKRLKKDRAKTGPKEKKQLV